MHQPGCETTSPRSPSLRGPQGGPWGTTALQHVNTVLVRASPCMIDQRPCLPRYSKGHLAWPVQCYLRWICCGTEHQWFTQIQLLATESLFFLTPTSISSHPTSQPSFWNNSADWRDFNLKKKFFWFFFKLFLSLLKSQTYNIHHNKDYSSSICFLGSFLYNKDSLRRAFFKCSKRQTFPFRWHFCISKYLGAHVL